MSDVKKKDVSNGHSHGKFSFRFSDKVAVAVLSLVVGSGGVYVGNSRSTASVDNEVQESQHQISRMYADELEAKTSARIDRLQEEIKDELKAFREESRKDLSEIRTQILNIYGSRK